MLCQLAGATKRGFSLYVRVSACVRVCVCECAVERERERVRGRGGGGLGLGLRLAVSYTIFGIPNVKTGVAVGGGRGQRAMRASLDPSDQIKRGP